MPEIRDDMQTCVNQQESKVIMASVNDLKKIFITEQNRLLKLAPSLSKKVLYPTAIERQNVNLCVRLFDNKNVAALKEYFKPQIPTVDGTIKFLNLVSNWWKIVNCKSQFKGVRFRDTHYDAIRNSSCDKNIIFLQNLIRWLTLWDNLSIQGESNASRNGKLTKQTSFSLTHTCKSIVEMCSYLIDDLKFEYFLLGKFQTDNLEGRFGQYRLMSGGNYSISVVQVLECERKLKLLSLLKLTSSSKGMFKLKDFFVASDNHTTVINNSDCDDTFLDILVLTNEESIGENEKRILIYIAGYIARLINKINDMYKVYRLSVFPKRYEF